MSNNNFLLRSKPNDLPQQLKLLQPLIKSFSMRPKLEAVQLGKIRDPQNRGHGMTPSGRLTSIYHPPSVTEIIGSESEGP